MRMITPSYEITFVGRRRKNSAMSPLHLRKTKGSPYISASISLIINELYYDDDDDELEFNDASTLLGH